MLSRERLVVHRDVCARRIERRVRFPDHSHWWVDFADPINFCPDKSDLCIDIYRIVSSKSLESSSDPIKPTSGDTLTVQPSVEPTAQKSGNCC